MTVSQAKEHINFTIEHLDLERYREVIFEQFFADIQSGLTVAQAFEEVKSLFETLEEIDYKNAFKG